MNVGEPDVTRIHIYQAINVSERREEGINTRAS